MNTKFQKLNDGWNAEPNAPAPNVTLIGADVVVEFLPNPFEFPEYEKVKKISLTFHGCTRWRLGSVNDEGWYLGQCRFSRIAPEWGEFYEVSGDLKLDPLRDWVVLDKPNSDTKHFLFYFRDEEFECDAVRWYKRDVA